MINLMLMNMIVGSLLEKEGMDEDKQISSVIFNRLDRKMSYK